MKISDLDHNIVIFGENHTVPEEVEQIRKKVIMFNPDVILHEMYWEDEEFYNRYLPHVKVMPLEDEVEQTDLPIKEMFVIRERSMIEHLSDAEAKYNRIAVVIGDTHLRTISTEELGDKSPIVTWAKENDAKVIRSSYGEIE